MSMKINQEYMDEYVINPMAKRLADIERKADLTLSNTEFLVKQFDKVIKNIKKVKQYGSMEMEVNNSGYSISK